MGAVDLVVQVESPPSVASGLQRIGRAGHQVGAVSRGVVFPKFRGDLVECAVVVERMRELHLANLPVVSRRDEKRLLGMITKGDIMLAYRKMTLELSL